MPAVTVALNPSYDIIIEANALARLGAIVHELLPTDRAILIVDANIAQSHGKIAQKSLEQSGYTVSIAEITADEKHKMLDTARQLYDAMLAARLDRGSLVIAQGGGITGDVAGFAAATFMRGLPVIQVPTTLLAMVDAAIGGKTGVNWQSAIGNRQSAIGLIAECGQPIADSSILKNMIGAFHQPRAVIADPQTLTTLDPRELRCGLAECIKHAIIAEPDLFVFIHDNLKKILALDMSVLTTLIERSARIKAAIVAEDERETGRRALLNLGHTFAHAIESFSDLDLKHGEAVAIGLIAAARAAVLTNRLNEADARTIESLIENAGLPRRIPQPTSAAALTAAMGHDKKIAQGRLRLILPTAIGAAEIVSDVPPDLIAAAWAHVGASLE